MLIKVMKERNASSHDNKAHGALSPDVVRRCKVRTQVAPESCIHSHSHTSFAQARSSDGEEKPDAF